jgi:5-dehydro-2-deoxygluconokinase
LQRLYDLGIKPDWWKLEPSTSEEAWENIVQVIEKNDPHCRGIVLLGLSAPIEDLVESFEAAAKFPLVKGFAVGRTIFHDVAREWMSGLASDAEAIDAMASRLATLVSAWRTARAKLETAA